ncbi:MAG: IMP dehydrogenase [bacterium]|nr:IMP dehydrogenase [bacterium]
MVGKFITEFMSKYRKAGLTFDDVSLVPQYADFLPSQTDLRTKAAKNITLNIPFISAAMDTVTEYKMAIEMAKLGGMGIIHKNLPPEEQAKNVAKVKHYLNGLIADPITFRENQKVKDIVEEKRKHGYSFNGFPIVDDNNNLKGIITARDLKFLKNKNCPIKDAMTKKVISAAHGVTINKAFELMIKNRIGKLPIVRNAKLVGLYSFSDVKSIIEHMEPLYNRDKKHRLRVGAAIGPRDYQRLELLCKNGADIIVVDTAHGHSKGVIEMTRHIKKKYPSLSVMAGNIGTEDAARDLIRAGADSIKVGIGPGSICTTRVVTGIGIPQITAVYSCAKAARGFVPVVSDGGIRNSGDVPKAIAAGASCVMMGSILAGTAESPGEKIIHEGRQYVVYRGMGSIEAMKSAAGSRERYAQQDILNSDKLVPEGVEGLVPFAGSVEQVLGQFTGGLRSSLGYNGCKTIKEFQRKARMIKITQAGVREAHPHDVKIIKEAPNYRT